MAKDKRIKNGGKRKGAGRKKGFAALQAETARKKIAELLTPHLERIINALTRKAKKGDVGATKELFDRAWGRAPQSTDITSNGETINALDETQLERIASRLLNGRSPSQA